jgi:hypothetical protein
MAGWAAVKTEVRWKSTDVSEKHVARRCCFMLVSCLAYSSTLKMKAMFLRNIRWLSTHYTALYPKRENSSDIHKNVFTPRNIRDFSMSLRHSRNSSKSYSSISATCWAIVHFSDWSWTSTIPSCFYGGGQLVNNAVSRIQTTNYRMIGWSMSEDWEVVVT